MIPLRKVFAGFVALVLLSTAASAQEAPRLPRMIDFGSTTCIPCKQMEPVLKELTAELAGIVTVEFINVIDKAELAEQYQIEVIPTQVFIDAAGKELFRHRGFYPKSAILSKWRELGANVPLPPVPTFNRWEPAIADTRPKAAVCAMCDGDVNPKTKVTVASAKGEVNLCSPHCFFVMYSCLTGDRDELESKASVRDYQTGKQVPLLEAGYLHRIDEQTGRPLVNTFATTQAALAARRSVGGSVITYPVLKSWELATRCGFCDRAVYPQDAALVKAGGLYTYGCCSHCALGVAARTGQDLEIYQPDRLTGEMIVVKTLEGKVASVTPATAVAWYGQKTRPDGKRVSAGCFHQGFFTSSENLQQWVEANPYETGELITIDKALADKMALSPEQIKKACKIGECAPK